MLTREFTVVELTQVEPVTVTMFGATGVMSRKYTVVELTWHLSR